MPKHLCKVSKHGNQLRVNIPKLLVSAVGWEDVQYLILQEINKNMVTMRRFVNGESLKGPDDGNPPKPD